MFGLFNNKEQEAEKEESPEFLALVEKWEMFLEKIDARFKESVVHAEEAVLENLVESDFDILPTTRAWQGMKSQLMALTEKVDETFDKKVKPQMLAYKEDWELLDEDQKGTILRESIFERLERHEILIEGKIAQKFYDHAIQLTNEDFNCTQCSAKLEVKKDIFRSHYVSCDYCNTVNTFTPNSKISEIRAFAVDNLAKLESIDKWDEWKISLSSFHGLRMPDSENEKQEYAAFLKKREETERAYWTKYYTKRSAYLPEYKDTIERDIDVKMKYFYEERKQRFNY